MDSNNLNWDVKISGDGVVEEVASSEFVKKEDVADGADGAVSLEMSEDDDGGAIEYSAIPGEDDSVTKEEVKPDIIDSGVAQDVESNDTIGILDSNKFVDIDKNPNYIRKSDKAYFVPKVKDIKVDDGSFYPESGGITAPSGGGFETVYVNNIDPSNPSGTSDMCKLGSFSVSKKNKDNTRVIRNVDGVMFDDSESAQACFNNGKYIGIIDGKMVLSDIAEGSIPTISKNNRIIKRYVNGKWVNP